MGAGDISASWLALGQNTRTRYFLFRCELNKAYISVHNLDYWSKNLDDVELCYYVEDLVPVVRPHKQCVMSLTNSNWGRSTSDPS